MLHSLNSNLKIGEITAAGLKLFRPEPKQQIQQDPVKETPVKATPAWRLWLAVIGFLGLLAVVAILAA